MHPMIPLERTRHDVWNDERGKPIAPFDLFIYEDLLALKSEAAAGTLADTLAGRYAERRVFTFHERDKDDGTVYFEGVFFSAAEADNAASLSPQAGHVYTWKQYVESVRVGDLAPEVLEALAKRIAALPDLPPLPDGPIGWCLHGDTPLPMSGDRVLFPPGVTLRFHDGLARVTRDGKYGYVDEAGILRIGFRFHHAGDFEDGAASVQEGLWGSTVLVDRDGNLPLPEGVRLTSRFAEGLCAAARDGEGGSKHGSVYGFVDRQGRVAVPFRFAYAQDFQDGLAPVKVRVGEDSGDRDGELYGFTDREGNLAVPARYDRVEPFSEGLAAVHCPRRDHWGFVDREGREVVDFYFRRVGRGFRQGVAIVEDDAFRWGGIDRTGAVVVPFADRGWSGDSEVEMMLRDGHWEWPENPADALPVEPEAACEAPPTRAPRPPGLFRTLMAAARRFLIRCLR